MNNLDINRLEIGSLIYYKDKTTRRIFEVKYFTSGLFSSATVVDIITGEEKVILTDTLKRRTYILLENEDQIV